MDNNQEIKTEAGSANSEAQPVGTQSRQKKSRLAWWLIGAGVILVGALVIAGLVLWNNSGNGGTVATFDGGKVSRPELDRAVSRVVASPQGATLDLEDPQTRSDLEKKIADELVTQKLLVKEAVDHDINVEQSEIDTRYQEILDQVGGEEALRSQLATAGFTLDELKSDLHDQIAIQRLIEQSVRADGMTISDEEVQNFYGQISQNSTSTPPLEDIRPQVEDYLKQQKIGQAADQYVADLKAESEIEILL